MVHRVLTRLSKWYHEPSKFSPTHKSALRFDQHGADPDSRFSGATAAGRSPFAGGADGEVSPEDLFNMFFGGGGGFGGGPFGGGFGGGPVFTASFGPQGFRTTGVRGAQRRAAEPAAENRSLLLQLLPLIILFTISLLSSLPSLFSTPDPHYSFQATSKYSTERMTSQYKVPYWVNPTEFKAHPIWESIPETHRSEKAAGAVSSKLRGFERVVERTFVSGLQSQCRAELDSQERRMEQHRGLFGIGANWEEVRKIKAEKLPGCDKLKEMNLFTNYY